jgi:hypothetical protein
VRKIFIAIFGLLLSVPCFSNDLLQGTNRQVPIMLYDTTTNLPKTGYTVTNISCRMIQSDMTTTNWTSTTSGGSHDLVESGNGLYKQELVGSSDLNVSGPAWLACGGTGVTSPLMAFNVVADPSYQANISGDVAIPDDFADVLLASHTTAGTVGAALGLVDASVSSVLTAVSQISTTLGTPSVTISDDIAALSTGLATVDDIWAAPTSGLTVVGSIGKSEVDSAANITSIQADTDDLQARTPAALISGRMDSTVGAYQTGMVPLQPTVASRTLDVTATGAAGVDWGNVENPTTTVGLTNTTISSSQVVGSITGITFPTNFADLAISTGTGRVTVGTNADKTGYALSGTQTFNTTGNITGNLSGSVGSVTGNVGGNVTGSVGSISGVTFPTNFADLAVTSGTGRVTVGTNADKTGYSLSGTQTFNLTGNITGNLSGSVGSVTGAVGSVTGNVGGNVTGSVGSVSGVTFPTNFNLLSINGSGQVVTTAGANTSIAAAVHDATIEGALTSQQLMRLIAATLIGKSSGSGTGTIVFRDANDTANRITATVSGGNRTAVTLNP